MPNLRMTGSSEEHKPEGSADTVARAFRYSRIQFSLGLLENHLSIHSNNATKNTDQYQAVATSTSVAEVSTLPAETPSYESITPSPEVAASSTINTTEEGETPELSEEEARALVKQAVDNTGVK